MPSCSVRLPVCPSCSCMLSQPVSIFSNFLSPSGSHTILVFPYTLWKSSDRVLPNCSKNRNFSTNICILASITAGPSRVVNISTMVIILMRSPSSAINKRRRAKNQWILFMTESRDVTPKTTERNLIFRTGKSDAKVINNKRLRSRYCTVEANYWRTQITAQPVCDSRASCSQMHAWCCWSRL